MPTAAGIGARRAILAFCTGYTTTFTWHKYDRGSLNSMADRPYRCIYKVTAVLLQTDLATTARVPVSNGHPNPLAVP